MEIKTAENRRGKSAKEMKSKKTLALLTIFLSIVLSIVLFVYIDFFREAKSLGFIGLFVINFVSSASLFSPAPAFLAVISGGSIYNPLAVASISALGASMGDMVGYLFGISGRHLVNQKLSSNKWFILLEKYFQKHANWAVFLFTFAPNPFFDVISLVAGIFSYSWKRFFVFMFLGRFLRFILLAYFGSFL